MHWPAAFVRGSLLCCPKIRLPGAYFGSKRPRLQCVACAMQPRILRLGGVRLAARKCGQRENEPYSDSGIRLGQVGKRDMSEIVTAGILVIGDEILSGRTKDKNIGFIAEYL